MKTLDELNETVRAPYVWSDKYELTCSFAVIGWQKTHIGRIETITAEIGEHKPGTYKVGDVFAAAPFCNGNGQHKGHGVRNGLDTKDVTCKACLKRLGA